MPILVAAAAPAGAIDSIVTAPAGFYRVEAVAPSGADTAGIPTPSDVVGWALASDDQAIGGARIDPVFIAAGRVWTPDQYRAAYGTELGLTVQRI